MKKVTDCGGIQSQELPKMVPPKKPGKKGQNSKMSRKNSIDDYKDRMTSPVGIVLTDPKTKKPIKK
ncbi:MAG: hypothetical protein J5633_07995 [Oscillospiraceae bacterium]|nr:hypothetical protein [Oscillospiraceae bacterium]